MTLPSVMPTQVLAEGALGWKSERSLTQMCADHWRWQLKNPNGYRAA